MRSLILITLLTLVTCALYFVPLPVSNPALSSLQQGRTPPTCLSRSDTIMFGDWFIRFQVRPDVIVNAYPSLDSTTFSIEGPSHMTKLEIGEGPMWGSVDSFSRFGSEYPTREVRDYKYRDLPVIDIRVRMENGRRSRLIGILGETASYENAAEA